MQKPVYDLIKAECIDWSISTADIALDATAYYPTSDTDLRRANAGHMATGYLKGQYMQDCDSIFMTSGPHAFWPMDIHLKSCFFKVSLDFMGKPLIAPGNKVAAPCPPFCSN
jgi:hypothetical protein